MNSEHMEYHGTQTCTVGRYFSVLVCMIVVFKLFVIYFNHLVQYISQGSVETHLPCGGIYNNHIIANCLQSVPVKEF